MGPRNRFQGTNSASLCSLAGRYDNPIPTRFLAPIECLKIPALPKEFLCTVRTFTVMEEAPTRRVTVTSSLNEISRDHLGDRVVEKGGGVSARSQPFLQQASGQIFKDDVNGFPPP